MSTTVATKIAEIKAEVDVGTIADSTLLLWLNQFENAIYNAKNDYKTVWLPRIKGLRHYTIPKDNNITDPKIILWENIRSVNIKDSNGEFQTAKKITERDLKHEGQYYSYENTQLCIPAPEQTDNFFPQYYSGITILNKQIICYTSGLSVEPEITTNSIKSANIDFTDYFIAGMTVLLRCSSIASNNGSYTIESITASEIIFSDATFTAVANDMYLIIEGASISMPYVGTGLTDSDSIVVKVTIRDVNLNSIYYDYYCKVTNITEYTTSTVLSFGYDSIPDVLDIISIDRVFIPGIKITYKPPYLNKESTLDTTPLLLPDQWSEAYNYFVGSKISEYNEEYSEAQYKREMAFTLAEQFTGNYINDEGNYPADDMIRSEW